MGDIKLFKIINNTVTELEGQTIGVERSLQNLIEDHLFDFLGVKFLASEYSTGRIHRGRIDTMGIDENNCPVIVEYKRSINENVINQGLYYLNWLLEYRGEFELKVLNTYGREISDHIVWSGSRLICIAGDFTRYDEDAIKQINRNIELFRYRRYGEDLVLFDLVSSNNGEIIEEAQPEPPGHHILLNSERLERSPEAVKDRYESLKSFLSAFGDDVQINVLQNYFAFKRIRNFACVAIQPQNQKIVVWANILPSSVKLETGFTRDVTNIGHHGTGNLEITISSDEDLEKAQHLLIKSYEMN
jgi:predicted transport protein